MVSIINGRELTKLETVWFWLVLIYILLFISSLILTFWGLFWGYSISIFIGGNIMNMVMFILCSKDKKRCFEVYYTDINNKEGRIKVWVNNVDEVDDYFAKKYPHLELYDIGEC